MSKARKRKEAKSQQSRPPRVAYEPDFKKLVVRYAEQNSTKAACQHYDVSESNVRRWKRILAAREAAPQRLPVLPKAMSTKRKRTRRCVEEQDNFNDLESMPLNKRILPKAESTPVLQSQPLSPTKLKVTRQQPSAQARLPLLLPKALPTQTEKKEVCLRWKNHYNNIQNAYPTLLNSEQYADVTLIAEEKAIKCHKMVLSMSSTYFEEILRNIHPYQHPVLILKDIPHSILKLLCEFMYAGEVNIWQENLELLFSVAETLKIKGLVGNKKPDEEQPPKVESLLAVAAPEPERRPSPRGRSRSSARLIANERSRSSARRAEQKPKVEYKAPKIEPRRSESRSRKKVEKTPKTVVKLEVPKDMDPLGLLKPVYEEAAPPEFAPLLPRDKSLMKKPSTSLPRKFKKRKLLESEHEESPPPVFYSRKGTRSRPNVKVPKYYNTDYDKPNRDDRTDDSFDPLFSVDDIKTEPIDVEDNEISFHDEELMEQSAEPVIAITDDTAGQSMPKLLGPFQTPSDRSDDTLSQIDPLGDVTVPKEASNDGGFIIESVITVEERDSSAEPVFTENHLDSDLNDSFSLVLEGNEDSDADHTNCKEADESVNINDGIPSSVAEVADGLFEQIECAGSSILDVNESNDNGECEGTTTPDLNESNDKGECEGTTTLDVNESNDNGECEGMTTLDLNESNDNGECEGTATPEVNELNDNSECEGTATPDVNESNDSGEGLSTNECEGTIAPDFNESNDIGECEGTATPDVKESNDNSEGAIMNDLTPVVDGEVTADTTIP